MISQSLKPMNEMFIFPPKIWVKNPTLDNYRDFFNVLANTVVPFARYMYNTVLVVAIGSIGHIVLASLCAYPLAKYKFPGSKFINQLIVYSLMFNATVTMIPNFLTIANLGFGYTGSDHYSWFCIYSWLVFDEKLYGADS